MKKSIHEVIVGWGDCDPAGIVFYPNFYRWMDDAAHKLFASVGLGWRDMEAKYGVPGMPLVSTHADFRSPARFDDALRIESHVSDYGTKSLTVSHVMHNGDRVVCEGWERRIWMASPVGGDGRMTTAPIPEEVKAALGAA
jgi:4-hydroxybenzoyl-CoA thioesterase